MNIIKTAAKLIKNDLKSIPTSHDSHPMITIGPLPSRFPFNIFLKSPFSLEENKHWKKSSLE